ncbi:MAG TPA: sigma-70 family RNA polymerase sigma factor [Ktedonobacteraceae bacterium]|nr:sigma-70 family RNA polymerase sigma factor [Ktedonobacteraceae bacterium]
MDTRPVVQEIETLIHDYQKLVFHTIFGLTGDWEESQDLTQDTFHQALRGLEAARASSGENFRPKAWLLRIALNTVRMQKRRHNIFRFIPFSRMQEGLQQENETELLSLQALPVQPAGYGGKESDDPAEFIAERDAVQRTLAKLPAQFRECLLLSIIGGLTPTEIAQALAIKEPAVRQRLSRARKQFQQIYMQESGEEVYDNHRIQTKEENRTQTRNRPVPSSIQDTIPHLKLSVQP